MENELQINIADSPVTLASRRILQRPVSGTDSKDLRRAAIEHMMEVEDKKNEATPLNWLARDNAN